MRLYPAALAGIIEAVLAFVMTFNTFGLTPETVGAIMAVVVIVLGIITAGLTANTVLGVLVGLTKAVIALFAAYNLPLSTDKTAALIGLLTLVVAYFQHTQTSPTSAFTLSNKEPVNLYVPRA